MFWLKIKVLISYECLASPLSFQIVILNIIYYIILMTRVVRMFNIEAIFSMSSFIIYFNFYIFVLSYPELRGSIWPYIA